MAEKRSKTNGILGFRLCEINARFPELYLLFTASSYQALASGDWNDPSIKPATDHNKLFDNFFQLFDRSKPIHLLRESLAFPSQSPLYGLVEERTGFRPRCAKPWCLRLVPCSNSSTAFELYCQHDATVTASPDLINFDGGLLERAHQVGLQLFDFEPLALEEPTIQEIARRSVNDLRSVFIAHDKRILGIIRQELDALIDKHIITQDQADLLRDGVIPTILPGSADLQDIIARSDNGPTTKDNFIIKPFRLARGSGIMRGKSISIDEWQSILEEIEAVDVFSSIPQYLLQPLLPLQTVDWFWDEDRQARKSQIVGTYFSVNGRFVGLGQWRTGDVSEETVSASTKDVTLVLSVVYDKEV
ncbi:unnamed protein product [Fusarium equiseti]|uniref:Uncharacterized protein n=1 Tax=Fusarium equiseti TaxID=61235 RepID=A0A8J2IPW7_FUSEQ|nr:unnamed protein product [Fusarium equiseti]